MIARLVLTAALVLPVLAGCVSDGRPLPQPAARPTPSRSTTLNAAGLEGVLGRSPRDLERLFGKPRLDVREADARKLQFANGQCVLDAYLYPEGQGGAEVVTYVDARRGDGKDVDRAACVEALSRR